MPPTSHRANPTAAATSPLALGVFINGQPRRLPAGAALADAVAALGIQPPFAAAVNLQFVPRSAYASHALHDGDRVELIAPITGG